MIPGMQLLIFDLDGTLIDSKKDLANSVNATRVHMGLPPVDGEVAASWVGNGAPVLIRRAAGECLKRVPLDRRIRLLGVRVGALSRPGAAPAVKAPALLE